MRGDRPNGLRAVVALVRPEATRYVRIRLLGVLVIVLAASVLAALGPVALKLVIDRLTAEGGSTVSPAWLVGLYVLSQYLARTALEARGLIYARAERRLLRGLSERLFTHVMSLPLSAHLEQRTGAVTQAIDNGQDGLRMILHHLVFTLVPVTAELATVAIVLAQLASGTFLVLFIAAAVCYSVAFAFSTSKIAASARAAAAARTAAGAAITDGLLNYEIVRYFTAELEVGRKVRAALVRGEQAWVAFHARYARSGLIVAGVFALFLGATALCAAREVQAATLTVGGFVMVNTYVLQMVRPLEMSGHAVQGLTQGVALLERALQIVAMPAEPGIGAAPRPLRGPGELQFERVSLAYRARRPVLCDVSLRVAAGRTVAIVGESGSGKSSLVRLLLRMVEPDSGRILIDGTAIGSLAPEDVRRAVAVVPQDCALFDDTIGYNIAIGRPGADRGAVERAAQLAHLHAFIMKLPDGYDTRVGERGVHLSGGERQRIAIARAVLRQPLIYVFDEVTSALDGATERAILESLEEVSRCVTTLMITHRLASVAQADEIVVLEGGRVAERGSHATLLRAEGRYAALWAAQHAANAI